MEHVLDSRIPSKESALLGVESSNSTKAEAFTQAFLKNSFPQMKDEAIETMMLHKAVVLEFKRPKKKGKKRKAKGLNAKERRRLKIFQLKPEHQKYELFLPLHELWKQYIEDLCNGLKPGSNPQMIQQKLLKADFHGAILTVVRSKCPSYVGLTGILVQEMKHIFKIITKEDKLKVIPKRNSVFSVEIGDFVTHIYGSTFELRSSERSAKKFKVKGTIDL
ncbi:ribonuclease P protein subunit p29 isoform X2 [Ctenopharyngodon idella]|uniref:ribonuclease P protein subunit p29 isoform X2 n=1 Tax=Ctenopharyngodon idella TaxID=7959 RepID=UPI00222EDACA|nr:ribonuclease P protein subunit p29 isoform X2 [Ctenopharyngodon idella]